LTNALRLLSVLLVALSLGAGLAHLFALPNKINLPAAEYLVAQQVYRGWALLGIVIFGAQLSTVLLAIRIRRQRWAFMLTLVAAVCIALSLAIFFVFTFPTNQQTANWTMLPEHWQTLRMQWEYSHAAGAVLYFIALTCLTLSLLPPTVMPATRMRDEW